jgi:hypothetical protein
MQINIEYTVKIFIFQNQQQPDYITLQLRKEARQQHANSLIPGLLSDLLVTRAADLFGVDLRERVSQREAVRWGLSVSRTNNDLRQKKRLAA